MPPLGRGRMMVAYREGGMEMLDDISPLWVELNRCLGEVATDFRERYRSMDFQMRREQLLERAKDGMLVVIASQEGDVAYCVSSLKGEEGWVESIFIREGSRGMGIGEELMRRSLHWLRGRGARSILLTVTPGNEGVMGFYRRFGFRPRKLVMELADEG